jgi:hypothetical protein
MTLNGYDMFAEVSTHERYYEIPTSHKERWTLDAH